MWVELPYAQTQSTFEYAHKYTPGQTSLLLHHGINFWSKFTSVCVFCTVRTVYVPCVHTALCGSIVRRGSKLGLNLCFLRFTMPTLDPEPAPWPPVQTLANRFRFIDHVVGQTLCLGMTYHVLYTKDFCYPFLEGSVPQEYKVMLYAVTTVFRWADF